MNFDCEIPRFHTSDEEIKNILSSCHSIAVVGLSPKPERASHGVSLYMQRQGYKIIPINPGHETILGEKCYSNLIEIPGDVDMVNIFRRPEFVPDIVDEAIAKKVKVIWMQEGIVHNQAAEKALAAGLKVVMNRCLFKEHTAL